MKTITAKANQTIYDIAVQNYGTTGAVEEILRNNPGLLNDDKAKIAAGIDAVQDAYFYPDLPVRIGSYILIDTDSPLLMNSITREMNDVTTFDYGKDNR
nr:MAG TPA: hypothetical protein [Caudoviricetes sp.]